ncbi:MAG TPA: amidase family protein, partial [Thermomicrobiales bacterium]|nr:amidase family protein [Thermomicrobiales bacterium]
MERPAAANGVTLPYPELAEATIAELQRRLAAGELTAAALAGQFVERIEAVNLRGPAIRAVLDLNPDAPAIAAERDRERAAGQIRGPLHGIPVFVKDNVATADRMETAAGSLALLGAKPRQDAHVARRLRDAGAVILGKTNLSEWSNFRSLRSSGGWSGRGGQTLNPYALDATPCGSSSGSGTA